MAKILHYVAQVYGLDDPIPQVSLTHGRIRSGEYIVIADDDSPKAEADNCLEGYVLYRTYDIEDTGTLPTERPLAA